MGLSALCDFEFREWAWESACCNGSSSSGSQCGRKDEKDGKNGRPPSYWGAGAPKEYECCLTRLVSGVVIISI